MRTELPKNYYLEHQYLTDGINYILEDDDEFMDVLNSGDIQWTLHDGSSHKGIGQGCFWVEDYADWEFQVMRSAAQYKDDQLEYFLAEYGWEDWMDKFLNEDHPEDDYNIYEEEICRITEYLTKMFEYVH